MGRELIRRKIDGKVYEFQQFGAKHSLKMLTKVSKIIGEPIALGFGALMEGEKKTELGSDGKPKGLLDRKINGKLFGDAVKSLTSRLDEDEVIELIEEFSANDNVLCDGKKIEFNSHYEGRLGHLFKVFAAGLEVQYGDFLGEILASQGLGTGNTTRDQQT